MKYNFDFILSYHSGSLWELYMTHLIIKINIMLYVLTILPSMFYNANQWHPLQKDKNTMLHSEIAIGSPDDTSKQFR